MQATNKLYFSERARRILVSILLAVYLSCIIVWGSPDSAFSREFAHSLLPLFNYFGLYASYGVYSPDPAKFDQIFRAEVRFKDGTTKEWIFPHLLEWKNNDLMKQFKLPWVEWQYYMKWGRGHPELIRDAARYVAWIHRNAENPPVEVLIYWDCSTIVLPMDGDLSPPARKNVTELVDTYTVRPEDLR